jgi:2-dehydropantoate 2-reductase
MRYVIFGAGAIGATIGGRLHQAGCDVTLIARGAHREALERDGLRLQTPDSDDLLHIPVAEAPDGLGLGPDDVVVLAMKGQDTVPALEALAAAADPGVGVVCAQNGVANERAAARRFANSYGMLVYVPAQHLEPGGVQVFAAPTHGVLDLGRVPRGADERAERIAADLCRAGFASRASERIMRFKYAKLLDNLGNAADALLEDEGEREELDRRAREEGLRCYEAAGVELASKEEMAARTSLMSAMRPVAGSEHQGGSSWQSMVRGTGAIEADYLNGEVVLLGRLHGVLTPVNETLQRLARTAARERRQPRSMSAAEIERELA